MPKDPTEKKEKKEKKEKREKRKKEVVEEAPTEALTTDVPEDVEMSNVEVTKVDFSQLGLHRSDSCPWLIGNEKIKEREKGGAG